MTLKILTFYALINELGKNIYRRIDSQYIELKILNSSKFQYNELITCEEPQKKSSGMRFNSLKGHVENFELARGLRYTTGV